MVQKWEYQRVVSDPRTLFLSVLDLTLFLTCYLSRERNITDFLVIETIFYNQVMPIDHLFYMYTVFDSTLSLTCCLSSKRNIGELLVHKTIRFDQVIHCDLFTQCECGEQEDYEDHRCKDVSHREILRRNIGYEQVS